jgi:hypothetical protein
VFAAHAALRAAITPGRRGPGSSKRAVAPESPTPKEIRLNWARRLKRVFGIEIEQCARCGGRLKVIASIEDPELIERILAHRRVGRRSGADDIARGARAAASFAVLISILRVDGAFSRTSGGRCCGRRGLRPYRRR